MKKQVTKETNVCDWCESDEGVYAECLICGKHACFDHKKAHMTTTPHAVHISGGCDGCYCNTCLAANPQDELVAAYRVIESLREEAETFYKDFKVRSDTAEKVVRSLYDSRGG